MSNLGDLLDDYELERLAKLKADDVISQKQWETMPQEVKDRINGVNAMIDATSVEINDGSGWILTPEQQARWDMCSIKGET